jgi:hypothetical protein
MPGGTSDGSSSVIQLPKTLSGNGENDSMDMSLARRKREASGQKKSRVASLARNDNQKKSQNTDP